MADGAKARWNRRYRERDGGGTEPARFVTEAAPHLPPAGRALDVGGGAGRHAIFLAERGLDVTIADVSPVGLELAQAAARSAGVSVETVAVDLSSAPLPAGPWDVVINFHYLERSLFDAYRRELAPGGVLVFAQPTVRNLERNPRPSRRFLLAEGELLRLAHGLDVIVYREGWNADGRHEAELIARRPR